MPKQTRSAARNSRTQGALKPKSRRSASDAPPFITAEDLVDGPNKFTIDAPISLYVRDDRSVALFMVVVNAQRQKFTWTMNVNGPDRIGLTKSCGRNIADWPGREIELIPQQSDRGRWFVNFYDAEYQRSKRRGGGGPRRNDDDDIPF